MQFVYIYIYSIYTLVNKYIHMRALNKFKKGGFVLEETDFGARTLFMNNKMWLSIEDIADTFGEDIASMKELISKMFLETQFSILENIYKVYNNEIEETETFYSIDLIISLGYRLGKYSETKFLIKSNRIMKSYSKDNVSLLTRFKKAVKTNKIVNIISAQLSI